MTITQPQDHLPPSEPAVSTDELLADLPSMKAPNRLRPRIRNQILTIAFRLRDVIGVGDEDDKAEQTEVDLDDLTAEQTKDLLDLIADFDEFAEAKLANDPAAYAAWSESAGYDKFSALIAWYGSGLGESSSSTS